MRAPMAPMLTSVMSGPVSSSSTRRTTFASTAHVSGKGKIRHREFAQGAGELSREEFVRFLTDSCSLLAKYSRDGAIHFVCFKIGLNLQKNVQIHPLSWEKTLFYRR